MTMIHEDDYEQPEWYEEYQTEQDHYAPEGVFTGLMAAGFSIAIGIFVGGLLIKLVKFLWYF